MTLNLSDRCEKWLNSTYGLMEGMKLAFEDPYSPFSNPAGCINLGAAENLLMLDKLQAKFNSCKHIMELELSDIRYNDMTGIAKLKQAASEFLNANLNIPASVHLKPSDISFHNGCGSAIETLFHVICDDNDVIIIPGPYYGGFDMDVERRAHVQIVNAPTDHNQFQINRQILDAALQEAQKLASQSKSKVRALLIMNPRNPQGTIFSADTIEMMALWCREHNLHYVVDEIYAFSVFNDNDTTGGPIFKSILSMDHLMKQPEHAHNTHFLWGFSKDFCLNGLRCGCVVSKNPKVIAGLNEQAYFTATSTVMQKVFYEMLVDSKWYMDFFQTNKMRLKQAYKYVTGRISEFNMSQRTIAKIKYLDAQAGFFIWVDFSEFLWKGAEGDSGYAKERWLYLEFIKSAKVYIAPGHIAFHAKEYGWFRIIFGADESVLSLAMDRIFSTLEKLDKKTIAVK